MLASIKPHSKTLQSTSAGSDLACQRFLDAWHHDYLTVIDHFLFPLQVLCIQGFLACRKHADRIILLVEMMQNSGCPCFKAGPRAVAALKKRFHLTLPESQVFVC